MKQLIFMIVMTLIGSVGAIAIGPFVGIWVYWFFTVLRPQFMWEWVLPPQVNWSLYVAVPTIVASLGWWLSGGAAGTARRFGMAHWCVLAFGFWVIVTYFTGYDREFGFLIFNDYWKYMLMFVVSALVICSFGQIWSLYVMIALTLGYIAYEVNFQYFINGNLSIYHNGYGGMDNNGAGMLLATGVPVCYFAWEGIRGKYGWFFLMLIPFLVHSVLMTYSRGAMVSLVVVTPYFFLRARRRRMLFLFAACMAVMLPVMAGKEIRERFLTISEHEVDASANSRKTAWAAGWAIAKAHPIFGVGLRNSKQLAPNYGGEFGRAIHSQYLQVAADNGMVGLVLYLGVLVTAWSSFRRVRRELANHDDEQANRARGVANGLEGALLVYCVGSLFLSCEGFELQYLIYLLAAQMPALCVRSGAEKSLLPRPSPGSGHG